MTTYDQSVIAKEFDALRGEIIKSRTPATKEIKERLQNDIETLNDVLSYIQRDNVHPDELAMPMHNIICIAPEEQYRLLDSIQALFNNLPIEVKEQKEAASIIEVLNKLTKKDVDSKIQTIDLSIVYGAYRRTLYLNGIWDNSKQTKCIKKIHENLKKIANFVIEKRLRGIRTADMIIAKGEDGVQMG